jgi:LPXTG-site transpeptidase (sortase) family protein
MPNNDNNEDNNRDLAASDSVHKFLNMKDTDGDGIPDAEEVPENLPIGDTPVDLPVVEVVAEQKQKEVKTVGELFQEKVVATEEGENLNEIQMHSGSSPLVRALKAVLPYAAIFIIFLALYFFYFSDFTVNSLFKSDNLTIENVTTSANNKDLENLKSDLKDEYAVWMKQFFFEVNDEAIISMDTDVSGNGLSNFEKYLLNLNPKVFSSRGSNIPDGELVIQDISPWTGTAFSDAQKELVNKYINKELINNRITAAALTRGITKFAQYVNSDSPYYIDPKTLANTNTSEVQNNQVAAQTAQTTQQNQTAPTTGNMNASEDINTNIPGKLEIPANKISVPLIWTKDVKSFDADLKKGIVHYPGTALPGQIGTSYISGHSSGYLWDKSPYKTIFAGLGGVTDGTSFTISATLKNGKTAVYHYVVASRGEFAPNDQAQFVNTADSMVALSTCWPIGSTAKRLVLFSKLSQVEQF